MCCPQYKFPPAVVSSIFHQTAEVIAMGFVFAILSVVAAVPQTHWVEARNFGDGDEITEAGKYSLWVCADVHKPVSIKLGEEEIAVEAKLLPENAKGAAKCRWEKAGERDLAQGKISLATMSPH